MKQKKKFEKEVMKFQGMTIMLTEDNGRSVYYIKERPSLTFTCVDEAMDYVQYLYKQNN